METRYLDADFIKEVSQTGSSKYAPQMFNITPADSFGHGLCISCGSGFLFAWPALFNGEVHYHVKLSGEPSVTRWKTPNQCWFLAGFRLNLNVFAFIPCCMVRVCCFSRDESYSVGSAPASRTRGLNFRPTWTSLLLRGRCLLSYSAWWCRPATCSSCQPTKTSFRQKHAENFKNCLCAALSGSAVTLKLAENT